jgi:hypothetical protein
MCFPAYLPGFPLGVIFAVTAIVFELEEAIRPILFVEVLSNYGKAKK